MYIIYLCHKLEAGGNEGLQLLQLLSSSGGVSSLSQYCLLPPRQQRRSLALWELAGEATTEDMLA